MQNIGTFVASNYKTSPLQVQVSNFYEYIRVINNSPYQLTVSLYGGSSVATVPEFFVQDITVPSSFSGIVSITLITNITTVSHAQSNSITINAYGKGELIAPQSMPIPQQAVSATASGSPIFSVSGLFGATATGQQEINVFNPANSGAIMTFHAAKVYSSNDYSAYIQETLGADLNFSTGLPIVSHTISASPPVSVGHATGADSVSAIVISLPNDPDAITAGAKTLSDLAAFPDNYTLYPGGNLTLICVSNAGSQVRLVLKYSESVQVPALPAVGGPTGVAGSIDNEGNSVGTSVIRTGIIGVGNPIQIFNDGSGIWAVDQSGVLHQVFHFGTLGNPLQLGQSGDISEVLGKIKVDGTSSLDNGSITTDGFGDMTLSGTLTAGNINTSGTGGITVGGGIVINGSFMGLGLSLANNDPIGWLDSGGIRRSILVVDASNNTKLLSPASGAKTLLQDNTGADQLRINNVSPQVEVVNSLKSDGGIVVANTATIAGDGSGNLTLNAAGSGHAIAFQIGGTQEVFIDGNGITTNNNIAIRPASGTSLFIDTNSATDTIQISSQGTKYFQVGNGGIGFRTSGAIAAGFQMIGDTSIANAGTSVAHNLGVIPQVIIPVQDAGGAATANITVNYGTATSTHFTAYTNVAGGTNNVRFFVLA